MTDKVNSFDASASALVNRVQSSVDLRGNVRIIVDDDVKGRYIHFDQHNIIVNGAKRVMAYLLVAGDASYTIKGLALGDKGHVQGDILRPIAPNVSDTGLSELVIFLPRTAGSATASDNTAKFTFVLGKDQGNGSYDGGGAVAYTEAGLYAVGAPSSNGILFAKETFPALVKNNTRQITFEWSIIF